MQVPSAAVKSLNALLFGRHPKTHRRVPTSANSEPLALQRQYDGHRDFHDVSSTAETLHYLPIGVRAAQLAEAEALTGQAAAQRAGRAGTAAQRAGRAHLAESNLTGGAAEVAVQRALLTVQATAQQCRAGPGWGSSAASRAGWGSGAACRAGAPGRVGT